MEFPDKKGDVEFAMDKWHNLTRLIIPCGEDPEHIRKSLRKVLEFAKSRREVLGACRKVFGTRLEPDLEKTFKVGDPENLEICDQIREFLGHLDPNLLPKTLKDVRFAAEGGIYMIWRDVRGEEHIAGIKDREGLEAIRANHHPGPIRKEAPGVTKAA